MTVVRSSLPGAPGEPAVARAVRRLAVLGLVLLLALGAILLAPPVALASSGRADLSTGREITRYDVTADAAADGTVDVVIDFDFDFGDDPGHGPYLTFPTRVSYDDETDRFFEFSDVRVTSPTGAPAQLHREDETSAVILRIGDEDVDDVSGVQTYRVEMTVDGWINPANAQHSGDELYWNVIGPGWEVPLSDLSVTVTGPAAVEGVACFTGPQGSTTPCDDATTAGDSATFTQSVVPVGDQLTTVTGWPGGTFPGVQPILRDKPDPVLPLRPTTVGGGVAAAVLLLGGGLAVRRVRRTGRDQAYLGLTPGLRPADGQGTASGPRDRRAPVAVQFQPPEGARPGEIGTLVDEKADAVDVTATIIDLAVRGWLRIEEVPREDPRKKPKDWTLVRLRAGTEGLLPFEAGLLGDLFEKGDEVRLSDLRQTFASSLAKVQGMLYDHVTDVGWFRANPKSVRTAWIVVGVLLLLAGGIGAAVAMAVQVVPGLALVGIALLLVGVLVLVLSGAAPARTPAGTAVLAQALGFRRYLATAEADQIRFEEGQDVFSRYLPYAIVFGLADRWSRVFAELAAQGVPVAAPTWYVGAYSPGTVGFWGAGFVGALDRFESITTAAISAPTPGTSGGSGLGGGGFSGGGVGGGGGGGW
ncbi:DUF2207 domain-containing protein [Cellulomonas dongxiuzhuiae]|uniref:DUF2207 domain-containing protein n=1 Tax=Cellulomonas dongxiuzhuiae TaxID=2819979 RepID=A0ABX8GLX3_9CELL|nr:DUF2207 domain-containing protein [Cellulomonas dongxiuzhuiae]MBO3095870.1 DUF2207 domain-containing protein [Cellulomonas dongxiuzhuiae]QWC17172.1 DUF2207 domain-containing protein [Cellulomonas dongxiuzhuiae]